MTDHQRSSLSSLNNLERARKKVSFSSIDYTNVKVYAEFYAAFFLIRKRHILFKKLICFKTLFLKPKNELLAQISSFWYLIFDGAKY